MMVLLEGGGKVKEKERCLRGPLSETSEDWMFSAQGGQGGLTASVLYSLSTCSLPVPG